MSDKPEFGALVVGSDHDTGPFIADNTVTGTIEIGTILPAQCLSLPGVTIYFDPPSVQLDPGVSWSGGAKMFWNEVARLVGQPAPFDW